MADVNSSTPNFWTFLNFFFGFSFFFFWFVTQFIQDYISKSISFLFDKMMLFFGYISRFCIYLCNRFVQLSISTNGSNISCFNMETVIEIFHRTFKPRLSLFISGNVFPILRDTNHFWMDWNRINKKMFILSMLKTFSFIHCIKHIFQNPKSICRIIIIIFWMSSPMFLAIEK